MSLRFFSLSVVLLLLISSVATGQVTYSFAATYAVQDPTTLTFIPGTVEWQFEVPSIITSPSIITTFVGFASGALSDCPLSYVELEPYDTPPHFVTWFSTLCGPGAIYDGAYAEFVQPFTSPGGYDAYQVLTGGWVGFLQIDARCGDQRDQIIQEYISYSVFFYQRSTPLASAPQCTDFTQFVQTASYNFGDLNTGDYLSWAIIRSPLVAPASAGYGVDAWALQAGAPVRPLNSVYRNPARNFSVRGAPRSRHMFGDAVDMRNVTRTVQEWNSLYKAARRARAFTPEGLDGPCGIGCVHADWRYIPGPWVNP